MSTVRAAISQTTWTGDQASMLDRHEQFARDAAADGAQVICFQELFHGPYFGIVQDPKYYRFAEPVDGPVVQRFSALAKELGLVMVLPIYEEQQVGVYYNTTVLVDADGTVVGTYRKNHLPQVAKFWEKFYFRPGNLGYPDLRHRRRPDRRCTSATNATSPRAGGRSGLAGARDRLQPESATKPGAVAVPALASSSSRPPPSPTSYFVRGDQQGRSSKTTSSVTKRSTSTAADLLRRPAGPATSANCRVRHRRRGRHTVTSIMGQLVRQVREDCAAFYRDRRPDSYIAISKP